MIEPWMMHTADPILRSFGAEAGDRPAAIVVDWEQRGKHARQRSAPGLLGVDTTIRPDDRNAIARVRELGFDRVVCRIDALGDSTAQDVADIRAQGGASILLPMWRTLAEVDAVLAIAGDLPVGVMVETAAAVEDAQELATRSIAFAFVGLVDLAIDRGTRSIFSALVDGTIDHIAETLAGIPLGFGGLTTPGRGAPVPNRLMIGELARVGASFSVMRRSFLNDSVGTDLNVAIREIRSALHAAEHRSTDQVAADRAELLEVVKGLDR